MLREVVVVCSMQKWFLPAIGGKAWAFKRANYGIPWLSIGRYTSMSQIQIFFNCGISSERIATQMLLNISKANQGSSKYINDTRILSVSLMHSFCQDSSLYRESMQQRRYQCSPTRDAIHAVNADSSDSLITRQPSQRSSHISI